LNINDAPVVTIPDMKIDLGGSFVPIDLCTFISDPETQSGEIRWTITGSNYIEVSVDHCIATILIDDPFWVGSDTVTFTATDNDPVDPLSTSRDVIFTVSNTGHNSINKYRINNYALYPNPTDGKISLLSDGEDSSDLILEVVDMYGRVLMIEKINQFDNQIDISDLAKGSYIIHIKSADKTEVIQISKY